MERLEATIGVHHYGGCSNKTCGRARKLAYSQDIHKDECFEMTNTQYRFIIAFENTICKDYMTEKIFNGLKHVYTAYN